MAPTGVAATHPRAPFFALSFASTNVTGLVRAIVGPLSPNDAGIDGPFWRRDV